MSKPPIARARARTVPPKVEAPIAPAKGTPLLYEKMQRSQTRAHGYASFVDLSGNECSLNGSTLPDTADQLLLGIDKHHARDDVEWDFPSLRMKLEKKQVVELVTAMQRWLKTGDIVEPPEPKEPAL